jgi:MYXO-CTERM domain-containing protein
VTGNRTAETRRPNVVRATEAIAGSIALAAAFGLASAAPAAADCAGPTVQHEVGTFDRGGLLLVEGLAFGDNCYDTGPPPAGEGVLGKPQSDITVFVVQGDEEHLVAEGAADGEYLFTVQVLLPAELEPGEADVVVRYAEGAEAYDPDLLPFTVSDAEPAEPAAGPEVATFGPVETEPEVVQVPGEGEDGEEGEEGEEGEGGEVTTRGGDDPPLGFFIASGVLALGAVAALLLLRKRQSSILEPDAGTESDPPPS